MEELDLIRFTNVDFDQDGELELNLPMLTSIRLEEVHGFEQLTLNAPKLTKVKIADRFSNCSFLRVDLVHPDPSEVFAN